MNPIANDILPIGAYLPSRVCAPWRTARDVGRWLEANGFRVIATIDGIASGHATTADGARVYRNGYCCLATPVAAG
jgi:hypothetical protein